MCDDKSSFGTFCAEDHHLALLGKQCRGRVFCPHTEGWLGHVTRLMTPHSCQSSPQIGPQSAPSLSHLQPSIFTSHYSNTALSKHAARATAPILLSCLLLLLVAGTLLQLLYSPANGCSLSALPSLLLLSTDHTFVENYNDDHQPHLLSVSVLLIGAATFHNI